MTAAAGMERRFASAVEGFPASSIPGIGVKKLLRDDILHSISMLKPRNPRPQGIHTWTLDPVS